MENHVTDTLETVALELEFFQPNTRARSNTWPLPRHECYHEDNSSVDNNPRNLDQKSAQPLLPVILEKNNFKENTLTKKKQKRLSYAELITKAIISAKDQRLILSDIYKWMIEHVPSIKNTKENAGWRNSVRHNLSLHNRFIRVPNEIAGKSSWWMVNLNEMFEKSTKRRSLSMEKRKPERSHSRAKNAQSVKNEIVHIETSTDQCQLCCELYSNNVNAQRPLTASVDVHQMLPIQNRCTRHSNYYGTLSPIPAVSNQAGWASKYCHAYETVVEPYDNLASMLKPNAEITRLSIPAITPDEHNHIPASNQTLTRFNSFLDDVTDIISKEMTDCKLKMK